MGLDLPQIVLYTSGLDHLSAAEKSWQRLGEKMLHSCGDSSLFSPLDCLVSEVLLVLISELLIDCLLSDINSICSFPSSCNFSCHC